MSFLFHLLVLCYSIFCVSGTCLTLDNEEENVNYVIRNLVQKLEDHEERIRVLENNDKNQQQEIKKLESVIRRKDFYLLRLKTMISRQRIGIQAPELSVLNKEPRKKVSDNVNLTVHIPENKFMRSEAQDVKELPESISLPKRLINSHNAVGVVAFYAYMSHNEIANSPHHIIVFDHVVTNAGGSYNPHIGAFTAPEHGFYIFSWTVGCTSGSYAYTEILRNSNSIGQIITNSYTNIDKQIATGLIATELNANDVVHVQTHSSQGASGTILSADYSRTSFIGWKL